MIKRKQYNSPNHNGYKKSIDFLTQIEISKKIYWRIFLLMQWVSYEGISLNMWYIVGGQVKNLIFMDSNQHIISSQKATTK
jgi:hypothetical protein